MVAPTVDPQTRNGLVYVDLPAPRAARAPACSPAASSTSAAARALTLPQSAVLLRDGFSYVLRVGADSRVSETKVDGRPARRATASRSSAAWTRDARVVAAGGGFLTDGDLVRVVDGPARPRRRTRRT